MRIVGKKIKIMKYMEVEETITKEKITSVLQMTDNKELRITVNLLDENDRLITNKNIEIHGEYYDKLFSDSVDFCEGKQKGSYREEDLWLIIDQIEP